MPDVLHWLGVTKIDNLVSMSNMKVRGRSVHETSGAKLALRTRADLPFDPAVRRHRRQRYQGWPPLRDPRRARASSLPPARTLSRRLGLTPARLVPAPDSARLACRDRRQDPGRLLLDDDRHGRYQDGWSPVGGPRALGGGEGARHSQAVQALSLTRIALCGVQFLSCTSARHRCEVPAPGAERRARRVSEPT